MDPRLRRAPVVAQFGEAVKGQGLVTGIYVGGSLATGDYQPGVSDVDAVALVDRPLTAALRSRLAGIHRRLVQEVVPGGSALHCVYVPREDASVVSRKHWTWAFEEFFRRPLSGIARAELLAHPIIVNGPPPSSWLPPMAEGDLREAARSDLAGYWTRALRKPNIWRQDVYVDIGLTVSARAEAAISEGVLITKSEAISRMATRGVLPDIVQGVARRRRGEHVELTEEKRRERAVLVREFLTREIERLLAPGDC